MRPCRDSCLTLGEGGSFGGLHVYAPMLCDSGDGGREVYLPKYVCIERRASDAAISASPYQHVAVYIAPGALGVRDVMLAAGGGLARPPSPRRRPSTGWQRSRRRSSAQAVSIT